MAGTDWVNGGHLPRIVIVWSKLLTAKQFDTLRQDLDITFSSDEQYFFGQEIY